MENENEPMVPAELPEWQSHFLWLRKQLLTILVLMVILCGALDIVVWHQVRYMRQDVKGLRAVVTDYEQNAGPMDYFLSRVQEYAQYHEDFRPVLAKYGIVTPTNAPAPPAAPRK